MESYGHGELSDKADVSRIKKCIDSKEFFINTNIKLKKVKIDETYPDYINKNQVLLSDWIVK